MLTQPVMAESKTMKYLKTYGIPCAASLIAGALLVKDNGMQVGAVGCIAASATVYVLSDEKKVYIDKTQMKELDGKIQSSVKGEVSKLQAAFKDALERSLSKALTKNSSDISKTLEMKSGETKSVMREVMAAQLIEIKSEMQADLYKKIENGEFMPKLKSHIQSIVKQSTKKEFEKNKKAIIEKAVESTIKQVIVERVGVPAN